MYCLNAITRLDLDKKYYLSKELNKKIKKIQGSISIQHFLTIQKRQNPNKIKGFCHFIFHQLSKTGFCYGL